MIIFHEGLPGAGKSFAVFRDHIVPRLKEGRSCLVYVEGVNHAQLAGIAEISEERCKELLQVITRDQVLQIPRLVKKDQLVVIDEAQNFWPASRKPLAADITQFVTEHRHLGLDIVLMGQVAADVHKLWTGRIDRKLVFLKLDALGADKRYKWFAFKRMPAAGGREKWSQTGTGEEKYDPAYFGCYASHEADVTVKENYKDNRFNIFKSRYFRLVLPAFMIIAMIGAWRTYAYLHPDFSKATKSAAQTMTGTVPLPASNSIAKPSPIATQGKDEPTRVSQDEIPPDMVERLSKAFRLRLIGTYRSSGQTMNGIIEWRAADNALVNRLTFREIEGMGYSVFVNREVSIAYIAKGRVNVMATSWSLKDDAERQVQDNRLQAQPALQSAPPSNTPSIGAGEPFPNRQQPQFVDAAGSKNG